jgi:hypothetical protein
MLLKYGLEQLVCCLLPVWRTPLHRLTSSECRVFVQLPLFQLSSSGGVSSRRSTWSAFLKPFKIGFGYVPDSAARRVLRLGVWKTARDAPNAHS